MWRTFRSCVWRLPPAGKLAHGLTATKDARQSMTAKPLGHYIIVILAAIILGSLNFAYGFAEDHDGAFVVEKALRLSDEGYEVSRTWGFPLYDLVVYPIIDLFGVFYAKLYSLVFYAATSALFLLTLRQLTPDPLKAFLGALCFVVLPVSIISGNTVLETSQGMFFAVLGLYSYVRYSKSQDKKYWYLMAIALGAAVSTRPDYVILSSAIGLTTLMFNRPKLKDFALGALVWTMFAFLPFLIYDQIPFRQDVVIQDPLLRKLARTLFGYLALLGLPATALLTFLALKNYRCWFMSVKRVLGDNLLFLFSVALALYSIRFAMLPDELEYVYVLVPLLVMVAIRLNMRRTTLVALVIAVAIPNMVEIHFFTRDYEGGLAFSPGLSPGTVAQDRSGRLKLEYQTDKLPTLLDHIAMKYGHEEYTAEPSNKRHELVIIPDESLRYYQAERLGGTYFEVACTQEIVVYPMSSSRGWRQFIEFTEWRPLKPEDFTKVTLPHCA